MATVPEFLHLSFLLPTHLEVLAGSLWLLNLRYPLRDRLRKQVQFGIERRPQRQRNLKSLQLVSYMHDWSRCLTDDVDPFAPCCNGRRTPRHQTEADVQNSGRFDATSALSHPSSHHRSGPDTHTIQISPRGAGRYQLASPTRPRTSSESSPQQYRSSIARTT